MKLVINIENVVINLNDQDKMFNGLLTERNVVEEIKKIMKENFDD